MLRKKEREKKYMNRSVRTVKPLCLLIIIPRRIRKALQMEQDNQKQADKRSENKK